MHVQKDEDGSVIKRIRRMTGVSGEGIESRRSGWMEVSQGVQETPVRLRLPLVCLIFFPAIDSLLSCLSLSGTPSLCQKESSRFCSRVCLCINIITCFFFSSLYLCSCVSERTRSAHASFLYPATILRDMIYFLPHNTLKCVQIHTVSHGPPHMMFLTLT